MKKTLIAAAVMAASGVAFAASNVTLYGVIEEGVLLEKAKHQDTTVQLKSGFDQGSRWGIKGVEDLGNGYSVGFILEQGFTADNGNAANANYTTSSGFTRESFMYVTGNFGKLGFGRTGSLSSGAQSNHILTGWALGTGLGLSSWTSEIGTLGRHLIQSFAVGETTPEEAHKIGMELAGAVLGGKYEFVLTTHVDKDHLHNHLIFNAVSFVDYKKYHSNKQS